MITTQEIYSVNYAFKDKFMIAIGPDKRQMRKEQWQKYFQNMLCREDFGIWQATKHSHSQLGLIISSPSISNKNED